MGIVAGPQTIVCLDSFAMSTRNYLTGTDGSTDLGGTTRQFYNPVAQCNQIQVLFENFYDGGAGETNIPTGTGPGAITVMASVEDPLNIGTPLWYLTFNGASSVTINYNGYAWSDPIDYGPGFPVGKSIWLRTYVQAVTLGTYFPCYAITSAQNNYPTGYGFATSDGSNPGSNYIQDSGTGTNQLATVGEGWISKSFAAKGYIATCVAGVFTNPTYPLYVGVNVIGDSRTHGLFDYNNGYFGYLPRGLRAAGIPYLNLASSSEAMATIGNSPYTNFSRRLSLTNIFPQITGAQNAPNGISIIDYGVNDFFTNSSTYTQVIGWAATAAQNQVNRGNVVWFCTVTPNTSASNGWTNTYLQIQANPTAEAYRQQYNARLRSFYTNTAAQNAADPLLKNVAGIIDTAAAVEASFNGVLNPTGGFWYCGPGNNTQYCDGNTGSPNSGGLHPNQNYGNPAMATVVMAALPAILRSAIAA